VSPRHRADAAEERGAVDGRSQATPALTPKEIAVLERLSSDAIYRAIQSGDLPARKVCGRLRVDRADYEAWKERHRVRPAAKGPMFVPTVAQVAVRGADSFLDELLEIEERSHHGT
jgi:excisionase family DNA binding protein